MSQPEKSSQKPLRVIVVGAGIVGLSLSHALQLANIDHVVLERNDKIMSVHGAALVRFCEHHFVVEPLLIGVAVDLSCCSTYP
jgi:pyruvate/2-oxoglutarate dehydrogenase complex dihydrolipoamide dehydrogenase (E3) component